MVLFHIFSHWPLTKPVVDNLYKAAEHLRYYPSLLLTTIPCTLATANKNSNKKIKIRNWNKMNQQFKLTIHGFVNRFSCFVIWWQSWKFVALFKKEQSSYHFNKEVSSVLCFNIHQHRKPTLAWICCYERRENLEGKFSNTRIPFHCIWHQNMTICCAEVMLLNLAFLKLSDAICVLIVNICSCIVKVKSLPYPCCILLSVREVVLKISFQIL